MIGLALAPLPETADDPQVAYALTTEVMAAASQTPDAQEAMQAFFDKRSANFAAGPEVQR